MEDDKHAIFRHPHILFDVVSSVFERQVICGERILGRLSRCSSVRDIQHRTITKSLPGASLGQAVFGRAGGKKQ
ncbi:MAG TPA: hypothetical protein VFE21_11545 [Rubrobacteraceae bacterium]|nr:hypothetical protein [Rubrobacteraceae bacterium]